MKKKTIIFAIITSLLVILPASASDSILNIFGNANEDETINMQDITYTELIILEYRDSTELSDAKYDGSINILDLTQIALIILGRENELTLIDSADRIVNVEKPVEKIVTLTYPDAEAIKIVKCESMVVGVSNDIKNRDVFFPEMSELPSAGLSSDPDLEKIVEMDPDLVCTGKLKTMGSNLQDNLPDTIAVTCWDMGRLEVMTRNIQMLGYILNKKEEADQFCNFYQEYIDEMIKEKVSEIPDNDKYRVYFESTEDFNAFATGSAGHEICTAAGGINIAADLPCYSEKPIVKVDPEWLLEQDPDIIIKAVMCTSGLCGYGENDPEEMKLLRDSIINRTGWEGMTAVKNNQVYLIDKDLIGSTANFVGATYTAKWLYPEIFEDLDPVAFHQEYLTDFQRLDYDVSEQGVFVYPN